MSVSFNPAVGRVFPTALVVCWLGACASPQTSTSEFQREEFESSTTYSRSFQADAAQTCEAARRALLSQGYVVSQFGAEQVNARKSFQPDGAMHMEIDFRVVCAAEAKEPVKTLAFVSALQDRYAVKKSNSSASVGVPALGSLSLPFTGSDDSLVKIASETISTPAYYDRFFKLLARYLVVPAVPAPSEAAASASEGGAKP